MIETNIKDRIPTYPGRVKLSPVAGQTNVYDMTRADAPIEEGTPLNKATLDSFITSRLTGRYYIPNVEYGIGNSRKDLTTSPLPTSGWVYTDDGYNTATSGAYMLVSESNNGSGWRIDGALTSKGWQNIGTRNSYFIIYHAANIMVKKVSFTVTSQYSSYLKSITIQGSTNGTTWVDLYTTTSITKDTVVSYTFTKTGDYSFYKVNFVSDESNRVTVKNFKYELYDINTYTNAYTITTGVPTTYDVEQRLLLKTPSNVNTFAVTSNTFNGIIIDAVLLPSTRYELVYNGVYFNAKGV